MANIYDHVLLSRTGPDKPAVQELAQRLVRDGIEPSLDPWNLVLDAPWMTAIEDVRACCDRCAVCLESAGFGAWQHEGIPQALGRRLGSDDEVVRSGAVAALRPAGVSCKRRQGDSRPAFIRPPRRGPRCE